MKNEIIGSKPLKSTLLVQLLCCSFKPYCDKKGRIKLSPPNEADSLEYKDIKIEYSLVLHSNIRNEHFVCLNASKIMLNRKPINKNEIQYS